MQKIPLLNFTAKKEAMTLRIEENRTSRGNEKVLRRTYFQPCRS